MFGLAQDTAYRSRQFTFETPAPPEVEGGTEEPGGEPTVTGPIDCRVVVDNEDPKYRVRGYEVEESLTLITASRERLRVGMTAVDDDGATRYEVTQVNRYRWTQQVTAVRFRKREAFSGGA